MQRVFGDADPLSPNWEWPEVEIPRRGFHKYAAFVYRPLLDHLERTTVKA